MSLKWLYILIISLIIISNPVFAKNKITLLPDSSSITVQGTSSLHDWEMHVKLRSQSIEYKTPSNSIEELKDIQININASDLKGSNNIMEGFAHNALKLKEYPFITFYLTQVEIRESESFSFSAIATGQLEIAGSKRTVRLPLSGKILSETKFNLSGKLDLRMSDFGVKAPKALFGAITTHDEISVIYSLNFSSKLNFSKDMLSSKLAP